MLKEDILPRGWIGACEDFEDAQCVLVGLPYDGTCSYRPGTRFGPEACRSASIGLETYSPYFDKDLEDIMFYDAGDLDLPFGNRHKALEIIEKAAKQVLDSGKKWLGIGGEHLVTYPVFKNYLEKYPDIAVIHFDAHTDLRDEYLGEEFSHATVIKRISDLIGPKNIAQIGIRSGTREEFLFMQEHKTLYKELSEAQDIVKKFGNRPIFLTIDLDVLDPSLLPGTGTPEAGGLTFNELIEWLKALSSLNFVGADVVELSPYNDPTGVSSAVASKVIREVLLLIN